VTPSAIVQGRQQSAESPSSKLDPGQQRAGAGLFAAPLAAGPGAV